jgi:hypothetical protein
MDARQTGPAVQPGFTPEEIERGEDRAFHIPLWGCLAIVALLGGLVYSCRNAVGLGLAVSTAETRPALLRDAEWEKPGSARLFARQFHSGTPAAELLSWLRENGFTIDRAAAHASRTIGGLPCAERIDIDWRTDGGGRLTGATAMVREAGCL